MAVVQPQRQPVAPAPIIADPEAHLGLANRKESVERHVHVQEKIPKQVSIAESDAGFHTDSAKSDTGLMLAGKPIRRAGLSFFIFSSNSIKFKILLQVA